MKKHLEDARIDTKTKLSVLWIALMFFYVYNDVISFYRKDTMEGVMSGEFGAGAIQVTPVFLLSASMLMAIPIFMIFLSLILPARINRPVNIIVGILHVVLLIVTALVPGETWAHYALFMVFEAVFLLLIIWHAWKWPTQSDLS
jgi:hypothetical protein